MQLSEDKKIQKYGKLCGHCNRNTLLPYENEFTCVVCGYNVIKRKQEFFKIQRKKIIFLNRIKYAEHKIFCICVDVYKNFESDDYCKLYEVLSTLKNEKLKIDNNLIKNYKDMLQNQDFEQDYWAKTAIGIYKIGHDSIRLMKWLI